MSNEVTDWFPGEQKPWEPGVYERQYIFGKKLFSKWNGYGWGLGQDNPNNADSTLLSSSEQNLPWRGLAHPTKPAWHGHYPAPLRKAPEYGSEFWIATPNGDELATRSAWEGDEVDVSWLQRGRLHPTREAAEAHARFEIELAGGTIK